MDIQRASFNRDANRVPTTLRERPIGDEIASTDTNVNQMVKSGTNTGTRTTTTFELTGIDTTNAVDYTGWVLEINTDAYRQQRVIQSNTLANPGVATLEKAFVPVLAPTINLAFLLYPEVLNPIGIQLHPLAVGTLTIYRAATADAQNVLAFLTPGDVYLCPVSDMRNLYYAFSIGTGSPEILRWSE